VHIRAVAAVRKHNCTPALVGQMCKSAKTQMPQRQEQDKESPRGDDEIRWVVWVWVILAIGWLVDRGKRKTNKTKEYDDDN